MNSILFVTLLIIFSIRAKNIIISTFIKDYFKEKQINQIVVFACWNDSEKMEFFNTDVGMQMKTAYIPIEHYLELKSILKVNYYKLGIVLDFDCSNSIIIFDQFDRNQLPYNESYFWLILSETLKEQENNFEEFQNLPLSVASEMTLASRENDSYLLYDIYNPSYRHGGKLNVTFMGSWNSNEGLSIILTQYKYKRRQNFHGLALNFSIVLNHPTLPDYNTYLTTPVNPHLDTMIRFHYALILQLKDTYNFSIHMTRAETWGYMKNGTFNGILGDMTKGIVDISAAPFQYKEERMDICEFTVQSYIARPCFIFRHPKRNELRNVFLKPFEKNVWWMILIVSLIYWILLLLIVKIEIYYKTGETNGLEQSRSLETNPASETALITTASICQQGLSDGPRIFSGRILFFSLFLWGLLLFQFYSASIVGSLLSEPPRFINNLKDLVNSNLDIGIEDIAYNYDYFATTTDPVGKELYERKIKPKERRKVKSYFKAEEGLERVRAGGFAFHVDIAIAYKIIEDTFKEDEICDLAEVQLFPARHIATITNKHSPFKKMITYGLRQIVEHGMTHRLRDIWHARKPQCPESHSSIPVPVALKEFSPALFSLILGMIIAFGIMLVEMFIEKRTSRSLR